MRALLSSLAILGLAASAAPAFASWSEPAAGLQCSGDSIAIRFGRSDNGDPPEFEPLPLGHEEPWRTVPLAEDKRCTLANGDRVEMHDGQGIAYPYGAGGGDAPYFFSLWINGRKVFSRENYHYGYARRPGDTDATSIFIERGAVERCLYDPADQKGQKIVCVSKPLNLAALPVDTMLPEPAEQALVGTFSIAATYSPEFCKSFVVQPETIPGVTSWAMVQLPQEAQRFFQGDWIRAGGRPRARIDHLDLWNSGRTDTVVQFEDDSRLLYGNFYFALDGDKRDADALALITQVYAMDIHYEDLANIVGNIRNETGFRPLPEAPDNSTEWTIFRLAGVTYVLEQPTWSGPTRLHRPNSPSNWRLPSLETLCVFQMTGVHF